MKPKKDLESEWKVPAEALRKKAAGEEAYFRSLLTHPDEEEEPDEGPRDGQELMENIFDRDLEI